ncbi:RNA polymerase sigma factor, sigma-70 family [Filimonas lacunae]|uniref:RNA polymerase sigma factor, sigma-70 family n=1 Tax=Filimonas lacunae TaxID=477680 RepID=A0A173MJ75_9BACT|nr:sigma-70 family RNA polymerase sigma factor [Filimonas lacunae]BAV07693.1 RNA polymerase ECF-type sigma factor [Filimonas lacunae]SIT03601.1 RNA polymerase sigma factor, sigma-70 family [Filimonas lacunae]
MNEDVYILKRLFQGISNGEQPAFNEFFRQYNPMVCKLLYKLTGCWDTSKDLAQHFYEDLWEKRAKLPEIANPGGYMYSTLVFMYRKYNRDKKTATTAIQRLPQPNFTNETQERLDEREMQLRIDKAAAQLPDLQRKVYERRRYVKREYDVIAAELNITPQTAKAYYYQAVKFLRAQIEGTAKDK